MLKTMRYAIWICALAQPLFAHDIITTNLTYTRDISRIFAGHCSRCHDARSSIPLTNYEQVRPWAVSIKEQVLSRSMPPWGAVKGFGNLKPDESLTQEDIMIVAAWVIGGAPKGDLRFLPRASVPAIHPQAGASRSIRGTAPFTLDASIRATGIRPTPDGIVESARIVANLPGGQVEPLVWLYHFDPKWRRTFWFREPLDLPKGTVIESSTPLRFAVESR